MRPGARHYVVTTEPAIVYGRHFYCSSTIKQSCYGAVHTLIGNQVLTNTQHARILHYIPQFGELWLSCYQAVALSNPFSYLGMFFVLFEVLCMS